MYANLIAIAAALPLICTGCGAVKSTLGLNKPASTASDPPAERAAGAARGQSGSPSSPRPATPGTASGATPLPAPVETLVDAMLDSDATKANVRNKLGAALTRFDERWVAYQHRRTEVDAAVVEAAELARAGDRDHARRALESVIGKATRDDRGELAMKRDTIEVRDAEVPAVDALVALAMKDKDAHRILEAIADLATRRSVPDDRNAEAVVWLYATQARTLRRYWTLAPSHHPALEAGFKSAHEARQAGPLLALDLRAKLPQLGIGRASIGTKLMGDHQYALLTFHDFHRAKLSGKSISFKKKTSWRQPYDCVTTNRIDSIDRVTGRVRYARQCKFRTESRLVTLTGTVAGIIPEWATKKYASPLVFARVLKNGPSWKIADLTVPDLRFLGQLVVAPYDGRH